MTQLLEMELITQRQRDPWGMTEMQKQMGNMYRGDLLALRVQVTINFQFFYRKDWQVKNISDSSTVQDR